VASSTVTALEVTHSDDQPAVVSCRHLVEEQVATNVVPMKERVQASSSLSVFKAVACKATTSAAASSTCV
jgi:hypothetical protein